MTFFRTWNLLQACMLFFIKVVRILLKLIALIDSMYVTYLYINAYCSLLEVLPRRALTTISYCSDDTLWNKTWYDVCFNCIYWYVCFNIITNSYCFDDTLWNETWYDVCFNCLIIDVRALRGDNCMLLAHRP